MLYKNCGYVKEGRSCFHGYNSIWFEPGLPFSIIKPEQEEEDYSMSSFIYMSSSFPWTSGKITYTKGAE